MFAVGFSEPTDDADDGRNVSDTLLFELLAGQDLLGGATQEDEEIEVSLKLKQSLAREADSYAAAIQEQSGAYFGTGRCKLCPWRTFEKRAHLLSHVKKHHSERKRWCASGTKQLRVLVSMYDNDSLRERPLEDRFVAEECKLHPGACKAWHVTPQATCLQES